MELGKVASSTEKGKDRKKPKAEEGEVSEWVLAGYSSRIPFSHHTSSTKAQCKTGCWCDEKKVLEGEVILWILLGGKPKWLPLNFGFNHVRHADPITTHISKTLKLVVLGTHSGFGKFLL